jgi:hypothetical protein
MKKYSLFLFAILLFSFGSALGQVTPQGKTKAEKDKEAQIQMAIDQQKKDMAEQQRALDEAAAALKDQKAAVDESNRNYRIRLDTFARYGNVPVNVGSRGNRNFNVDQFTFAMPGGDPFYAHALGSDAERTTWDFSKTVKEKTFSRDYTFDVDKTAKNVVMSVMGDCKSGEIRIKILMPNGKSYSDILIDESGNLNWRKSFAVSETENQDKTGEWKFQISSTKASGYFKISLQTN